MPKYFKKIPHVLVILPTVQKACRDKLQGILKYARIHCPWDVQTLDKHPYIAKLGGFKTWKPDGIIDGDDKSASIKHVTRIPVVKLDPISPLLKRHSSVHHDSQLIAATVVNHFLQAGLKHFGFIGCLPSAAWSRARSLAFSEHLTQAGFHSQLYEPQNAQDWGLEQMHMSQWLLALPKPCGIMVAVDLRAKQVLDTCIAHFRLARVCSLLRETNLPIQEIGERCGYDTELYLKVLFKKRFGMTMREFRKRT